MPRPGPDVLGRGVVIAAGARAPSAWAAAEELTVDDATLADPAKAVTTLHRLWSVRARVVVKLAVDAGRFSTPDWWDSPPWSYGPDLEAWHDRLHFLVWANNYDARRGDEPVWWWGRKAARLGAIETPGGTADVLLADGRPAWIDGGPRGPLFDPAGRVRAGPVAAGPVPAGPVPVGPVPAGPVPAGPVPVGPVPAGPVPAGPVPAGTVIVHAESVDSGSLRSMPEPVAPSAELAADQLAAVAHGSGPARIIAPAGSGKTRVLTERLRHLIVDRGMERDAVLAVAYNKKAQQELEERCADFRPRAQTLNALGYSILARYHGQPPRVLEEREVRRIVDDLAPARQRRVNTDPIGPYLEALSAIRLALREPIEVEESRDDVPGLAAMFDRYREQLAAAGAIDFDEQVYGAIEVLLREGSFRREVQVGYRHLLVDEFQDLTPAHLLLIRLLAGPRLDVFGVGDDDQVIYGHAGADPSFLIDFATYFPGAADHPLEVNYRCPVSVVDGARILLSYNDRRVTKQIRPGPSADPAPDAMVVVPHRADSGATTVVDVVSGWLEGGDSRAGGVAAAQVAVLARVNSMLVAPHVALSVAGIPLNSVLRPDVLERTGVRAALAYLRIGADPRRMRTADLTEVYRRPSRGFPQWFTKWLRDGQSVDDLVAVAEKIDDERVAEKVVDFAKDLQAVADAVASGTTATALDVVRDVVGLGGAMTLLDSSGAGEGAGSHVDDLTALAQVAVMHPDPTTFEAWLRGTLHREADPDGVTLSTIHRVKGREWDSVVVYGVTTGIVPHRLAEDVEEERRVLHVAMTRGIHRVRLLTETGRESPFLAELSGKAQRREALARATARRAPLPAKAAARSAGQATARAGGRTVEARVGLALEATSGAAGVVESLDGDGVRLRLRGGDALLVRYGEAVMLKGKPATLVARPDLDADTERAEEALRAWRLERCQRDKVSAFIVLYDRHLRAIATKRPTTLADLRRIEGIGPTKLELYGDEILEVLASVGAAREVS